MTQKDQELLAGTVRNFPNFVAVYVQCVAGALCLDEDKFIEMHELLANWASKQMRILEIGEE